MAKKTVSAPAALAPANRPPYMLIEEIRVQGYKSLVDATLHVRPLTLLAGTNSSGKSSIMQPLLLIKQTMEAPYQPAGALVLDGAHVQAETAGELVSKIYPQFEKLISVEINGSNNVRHVKLDSSVAMVYYPTELGFSIIKQDGYSVVAGAKNRFDLTPSSTWKDIYKQLEANGTQVGLDFDKFRSEVKTASGFLNAEIYNSDGERARNFNNAGYLISTLAMLFHIPGLRVLPKRRYPVTTFQNEIKGTFDLYSAGTVSQWQQQQDTEALTKLNDYLRRLGLTDSVTAKVKNANEVELSVSRLPTGSKGKPRKADMVNIADVGIGVSQVLPILVALIAAQDGQIVYVEQPELHLHPRAQVAMAELLAEAANRGVRVIVETHSSLLLLTVQTLIAQERIKNTDVALHWFARDAKGATQVTYVQPDEDGAYGEWPEDFGDVELRAQDAYLTAVGLRHFGKAAK